jgi:Ca2+-binding EF-hand superfamily protein
MIRSCLNLQANSFAIYLKEVYSDLSQRPDSDKDKGISKITFSEYLKLPSFINNKFFSSLDRDNNGFINFKEFSNGMNKLFLGSFEETAQIIFWIFDFDKDLIIKKADVKLLLSYLPLKSSDEKNTLYKSQMDSLEELDEILLETFGKGNDSLNFEQYLKTIETTKSDIYIQLLCFLYNKKPFEENTINQYKKLKKNRGTEETTHKITKKCLGENLSNSASESKRFPSPSRKTKFFPAENFMNISLKKKPSSSEGGQSLFNSNAPKTFSFEAKANSTNGKFKITLNSVKSPNSHKKSVLVANKPGFVLEVETNESVGNSPKRHINDDFIRMPNRKVSTNSTKINYDEMLRSSKNFYDSPTKILKTNDKTLVSKLGDFNLEDNLIDIIVEKEEDSSNLNLIQQQVCITHEDWLFFLEKDGKLRKCFVALIGNEMSVYRTNAKDDLISLINLCGCFIKDLGSESKVFEKEKYYGFDINMSKDKNKTFYCNKLDAKNVWVSNIKKSVGYENFADFYDVNQLLGEGLFGIVKKAIHKKTNQIVAVKIINKDKLRSGEIDLIRTEIDLMKLFQHPNIVKLVDHFENAESIYIVMEFLEGGTLLDYLESKEFNLSEKVIAKILYCVGSVVKYLNSYGVIHRDLKPENIMLSDKSDNPVIKIIDFGLTRTLAPGERLADGFGTITYVAPEVLTRKPYNKQIDIWSMGVILYFLLSSGKLPFDDENNNEEIIAKKAVLMDPAFPEELFGKRSKTAMLLVNECLCKDPEKRITIDIFMKNEWLKINFNY